MRRARGIAVLLLLACAFPPALPAQASTPTATPAVTAAKAGQAPFPEEAPGCEIARARDLCAENSGNGADVLRCSTAALDGAKAELHRVLSDIRPRLKEYVPVSDALEAAQIAWALWVERDCAAVSADWEGGSMRAGVTQACRYEHVLARAQVLWLRHVRANEGQIPEECLPGR
jgi:uncharacterized protein YecT (DUF1311 family)